MRSTLGRRRNSALVSGSVWATRAASIRSWWGPTTIVRPPLPVVQASRSGQAWHVAGAKWKVIAGRPLWSVQGRTSVVVCPAGQVTLALGRSMSKSVLGNRPRLVTGGTLATSLAPASSTASRTSPSE